MTERKKENLMDLQKIAANITAKYDLKIKRVPEESLQKFRQFASAHFSNDYGMALKWLLDYYDNLLPPKDEELKQILIEFDERLAALEKKRTEPAEEKKTIRVASGEELGGKK